MNWTRTKTLAATSIVLILTGTLLAVCFGNAIKIRESSDLTRVACVGDSITEQSNYLYYLQTMLGNNSLVGNFGEVGATVDLGSVRPYLFQPALQEAKKFEPTTVIIMLGTNDARSDVYPLIGSFVHDYKQLINEFKSLKNEPQIFLVLPPPIFNNTININPQVLAQKVISNVGQVAKDTGLPVIDVYSPMVGHPEYFIDGVHPNDAGASVIANTIARAITP
jgi:acyl-CoA thioesterase-1